MRIFNYTKDVAKRIVHSRYLNTFADILDVFMRARTLFEQILECRHRVVHSPISDDATSLLTRIAFAGL